MSSYSAIPRISSVTQFVTDTVEGLGELEDDPFIVIDLSMIKKRFDCWVRNFPKVEPFFALKAQHNYQSVKLLTENSCGFDVASLSELQSVLKAGCDPSKILYAQPYKQPSHLRYALENGIITVCDSVDEVKKVGEMARMLNCSTPNILIRILPDDKGGESSSLSSKFGAPLKMLPELGEAACSANVAIAGISFHIGSHCHSSLPYRRTLKRSRMWWNKLSEEYGCPLQILDIGGGFPGEGGKDFERMASEINTALGDIYGDILSEIRVIAEPGRYMVTSSGNVVAHVIAEKGASSGKAEFVLNTGVYGGLSSCMWDKKAARSSVPYVVKSGVKLNGDTEKSEDKVDETMVTTNGKDMNGNTEKDLDKNGSSEVVLWGPTCDSSDKMVDGYCLNGVKRGDWIVFPDLGAYCSNIMTNFNGFPSPKTYFVRSDEL